MAVPLDEPRWVPSVQAHSLASSCHGRTAAGAGRGRWSSRGLLAGGLAAAHAPHPPLGVEVVVEVPHSEPLHLQPCLQDPGWGGGVRAAPQPRGSLGGDQDWGYGGEWGCPDSSGPCRGRACMSGLPLSLQNPGVGWNGRGHGPGPGAGVSGLPLLSKASRRRGTQERPVGSAGRTGSRASLSLQDPGAGKGFWGVGWGPRISLGLALGLRGGGKQSPVNM